MSIWRSNANCSCRLLLKGAITMHNYSRRKETESSGQKPQNSCVARYSHSTKEPSTYSCYFDSVVHLLFFRLVSFTFVILVVLFLLVQFRVSFLFHLFVHRIIQSPNFCIILNHTKITFRVLNPRWVTNIHYKAKFFVSKDQGYCIMLSRVAYRKRFTSKENNKKKEINT